MGLSQAVRRTRPRRGSKFKIRVNRHIPFPFPGSLAGQHFSHKPPTPDHKVVPVGTRGAAGKIHDILLIITATILLALQNWYCHPHFKAGEVIWLAQGYKPEFQVALVLKFILLITKIYQYKIKILAGSKVSECLEFNILVQVSGGQGSSAHMESSLVLTPCPQPLGQVRQIF